jgi:GntR family transcriptional regulator of abcA and norABC
MPLELSMIKKDPFLNRSQSIALQIKEMIVNTGLTKGDQLPPMRAMAKMFFAGSDAIEEALEILRAEGIIITKPRYGTFITNSAWQIIKTPNWREITKTSVYNPTDENLQDMFFQLERADNAYNVSMLSVSDGIYADLFKHANKKLHTLMKNTTFLEEYHIIGLPELMVNIAEYMKRYGMDVDPRQIVICAHIQDAVSLLAQMLVKAGVTVLHEIPGMINHQTFIRALGAALCGLDMDHDGVNEDQFLRQVSERKNMVFCTMPLFSFPTGTTTSLWRKKRILNFCLKANIPIVEIDDFRCLDFDAPETYYSLSGGGNVIYIGSFSRMFPFGIPISWLVLPFRLVKIISDIKFQRNWGPDLYSQMLVSETLKDGSFFDYLTKLKKHLEVRNLFSKEIIDRNLADIVETIEDRHPFAYWVKLRVKNKLLMKHNKHVNIAMGSIYSDKCDQHIVISKTHPHMSDYEQAISHLKELLQSFSA